MAKTKIEDMIVEEEVAELSAPRTSFWLHVAHFGGIMVVLGGLVYVGMYLWYSINNYQQVVYNNSVEALVGAINNENCPSSDTVTSTMYWINTRGVQITTSNLNECNGSYEDGFRDAQKEILNNL